MEPPTSPPTATSRPPLVALTGWVWIGLAVSTSAQALASAGWDFRNATSLAASHTAASVDPPYRPGTEPAMVSPPPAEAGVASLRTFRATASTDDGKFDTCFTAVESVNGSPP